MITKFGKAEIYGYYKIISVKEGNQNKFLHKLIWEDHYGKPVPEGYVIHHIDKNPLNNKIQNLQCVEKGKHSSFHNKGHLSGEKNPMYNKIHNTKIRRKISNAGRNKGLFGFTGANYHKNIEKRPFECRTSWKGKMKYLCMFEDPLSCEIVNKIVTEELLKIEYEG